MTHHSGDDIDLQKQMTVWADDHMAPVSSDVAETVVALRARRKRQIRRWRAAYGIALVVAVAGVGWWRYSAIPMAQLVDSPMPDDVVKRPSVVEQPRVVEQVVDGSTENAWQREVDDLLVEMQQIRENIEQATAELHMEIALQESALKVRDSRRHRLYEEQASQWLATRFSVDKQ